MLRNKHLKLQAQQVIMNVLHYFERERDNGGACAPFTSVMQRTAEACGISDRTLTNIKKRFRDVAPNQPEVSFKRKRNKAKSSEIDDYIKDFVKRKVFKKSVKLKSFKLAYMCLKEKGGKIVGGQLTMSNLKAFLVDKNLPLKVWISEGATKITTRIQYDASTNQIVGLVQKTNSLIGFLDTFSYSAESVSQIENVITINHVSSLAYVIMAQPLSLNAPSFCLSIYGKDNKLTEYEVLLRWRTILKEVEDVGIEV
ncbi:hypothetical protein FQA39_LY09189 [Lamprigera yunnana]|nr:hypothetical protein FQA39_LY09189 [Lamprigera yunnana]